MLFASCSRLRKLQDLESQNTDAITLDIYHFISNTVVISNTLARFLTAARSDVSPYITVLPLMSGYLSAGAAATLSSAHWLLHQSGANGSSQFTPI